MAHGRLVLCAASIIATCDPQPELGLLSYSHKVQIQRDICRTIAAVIRVKKATINNVFTFSESRYLVLLGFAL